MAKKHRHYCKVCREYKSNESFSGSGHAAHICKKCAALPAAQRSEKWYLPSYGICRGSCPRSSGNGLEVCETTAARRWLPLRKSYMPTDFPIRREMSAKNSFTFSTWNLPSAARSLTNTAMFAAKASVLLLTGRNTR